MRLHDMPFGIRQTPLDLARQPFCIDLITIDAADQVGGHIHIRHAIDLSHTRRVLDLNPRSIDDTIAADMA